MTKSWRYRQVYIETLENRIARMEEVMKTFTPEYADRRTSGDLGSNRKQVNASSSNESDIGPAEQVNGLAVDAGSLLLDNADETQYLGG
jgi:hypothetical protein